MCHTIVTSRYLPQYMFDILVCDQPPPWKIMYVYVDLQFYQKQAPDRWFPSCLVSSYRSVSMYIYIYIRYI